MVGVGALTERIGGGEDDEDHDNAVGGLWRKKLIVQEVVSI